MPQIVTVAEITETEFSQLFDQFEGQLEDKIDAAEQYVRNYIGFDPVLTTSTEVIEVKGKTLFLSAYPLTEVTTVEYSWYPNGTWTELDISNLYVNLKAGYIRTYDLIVGNWARVTYTSGYATIPADLKQAVILQTAILVSPDYEIFGSGDSKPPGLDRYDAQIKELLEGYKKRALP